MFKAVQELAWGTAEPEALLEAAREASPLRHIGLLFGAGLITGAGQWLLTRLTTGNGIEITAAIWFQAGRVPALRTLGSAVLSIVIVGMGAPLGREGGPKQFGAVFGNLASDLQKLSDDERRLMVAIGAGAGMAAVYSVPLGGALFALEVLRGALALRLVMPALTASLIAVQTASLVIPNAPLYTVPGYVISPDVYLWVIVASPFIGLWSVLFVRAIAWADRARPSGWLRLVAPPAVFAAVGLLSIVFPELLGNGQDLAQLLFGHPLAPFALAALFLLRPLATVASAASGAPGGLFTPSLAAGALIGAALGGLWLSVHPGGEIGLFALLGSRRNARCDNAGTGLNAGADDGADRTGARFRIADADCDHRRHRDLAPDRAALDLRGKAHRRASGGAAQGARDKRRRLSAAGPIGARA